MTRRLTALLITVLLSGALVACGGDGDGDAPDTSGSPDTSQSPTDDPSETSETDETGDGVLPIWEDQLCAGLSLDEVSAALGSPTTVANDLVAGDPDPIIRGNKLTLPYCHLTSGPVNAELVVNEIEAGTPLLEDIERGLQAVTSGGFLECGGPRATKAVPGHEAYVHICQGPQGTIGAATVGMGPDWSLNCAVTGGTQKEKEATRVVSDFCAVVVATLVG